MSYPDALIRRFDYLGARRVGQRWRVGAVGLESKSKKHSIRPQALPFQPSLVVAE